ncbi:hypothetical protein PM082_009132 [Marasmius tenuissimus]|nr:hypothetical protein PM082_009132 [Marasmius tenuissimus]
MLLVGDCKASPEYSNSCVKNEAQPAAETTKTPPEEVQDSWDSMSHSERSQRQYFRPNYTHNWIHNQAEQEAHQRQESDLQVTSVVDPGTQGESSWKKVNQEVMSSDADNAISDAPVPTGEDPQPYFESQLYKQTDLHPKDHASLHTHIDHDRICSHQKINGELSSKPDDDTTEAAKVESGESDSKWKSNGSDCKPWEDGNQKRSLRGNRDCNNNKLKVFITKGLG